MIYGLRLLKNDESFSEEGLIQKTSLDKRMRKTLDAAMATVCQHLLDTNGAFEEDHETYRKTYEALLETSANDLQSRAIRRDHDLLIEKLRYMNDYCYLSGMKDSLTGEHSSLACDIAEEDFLGLDALYNTEKYKKFMDAQERSWARLSGCLSEPQEILCDTYKEKLTFINYEMWVYMYIAGYEWGLSVLTEDERKNAYLRKLYKRYGINE